MAKMAEKLRTTRQNSALHKLLSEMADELNGHGMTMMKVLSQNAEIEWTPESVKNFLLRPFIRAMYQKESTTQLSTKELSKAADQMLSHVAKVTGLSLDFPSLESQYNESQQTERVWRD